MTPLEINKKIAILKKITWKGMEMNSILTQKNWAENISDAWELFEEMSSSVNLDYDLCLHKVYDDWCVSKKCVGDLIKLSESKTAPEAICLAWIKWKEGK